MQVEVSVTPLGAGQEVGRSCLLLSFADERHILLDCGVHMGHNDRRKYPDFSFLQDKLQTKDLNSKIDFLLLSHFHLDHCAALPFFVNQFGYNKPIFASEPTRAILPYMLKDYIRVSKDTFFRGQERDVARTMQLVQSLTLNGRHTVNDVRITSFYAGHVLGAVMFLVEYKGVRVLYTGDYNSAADRHLAALKLPDCRPDIVITETTYATIMKDWKKQREMQFMCLAKKTLERGGKILIPVFALGRAQELMILIDDLWEKTGWQVPVYYAGRLVERVQFYYKLFLPWTNQNLQRSAMQQSKRLSGFTRFRPLPKGAEMGSKSIVMLATPGMLHAGRSLELFKSLCLDGRNSLLIPGFCVKGTFGARLLAGDNFLRIHEKDFEVKMEVAKMSFSAHADSKGITDLLDFLSPEHVVFVHGEKTRMQQLAASLRQQRKPFHCHCPANHEKLRMSVGFGWNKSDFKQGSDSSSEGKGVLKKRKSFMTDKRRGNFRISEGQQTRDQGGCLGDERKSGDFGPVEEPYIVKQFRKFGPQSVRQVGSKSENITKFEKDREFPVKIDWSTLQGDLKVNKGDLIRVVKERNALTVLQIPKPDTVTIRRLHKKKS